MAGPARQRPLDDTCARRCDQAVYVWILRRAVAHDAGAIGSMHRRSAVAGYSHVFPQTFPPPPEDDFVHRWTTAIAAESPWTVLVAEQADLVIGVAMFGPDPDHTATGHVARIYVDPVHWGEGIGGVLHDHALQHLARAGYADATLWVLDGNERAAAWYRRRGWTPTGDRRDVLAEAGVGERRLRRPVDMSKRADGLRPTGTLSPWTTDQVENSEGRGTNDGRHAR